MRVEIVERSTQAIIGFILLVLAALSVYSASYYTTTAIPYSFVRWAGGTIGFTLVLVAILAITRQRSKFQTALVFGVASVFAAGTQINDMFSRHSQVVAALNATEAMLSGEATESNDPMAIAIQSYSDGFESAYSDYAALLDQADVTNALQPQGLSSVAEATSMRESLRKVLSAIPDLTSRGDQAWVKLESDLTEIGTETARDYLTGAARNRDKYLAFFNEYFRIQSDLLESFIDMQTLAIDSGGIGLEGGQYILADDDSVVRFNAIQQKIQTHVTEEEDWVRRQEKMVMDAQQQMSEIRISTGI